MANKTGKKQLVVADDIADSFDYSNKYAIIEYLSELSENQMIDLLILTHNFDFYRTISSRLNIKYNMCFIAQKTADGKVVMSEFQYRKDYFSAGIIEQIRCGNLNDNDKLKAFVAAIPFCRNICEYTADTQLKDFLTGVLHVKLNTEKITIKTCWETIKQKFLLKELVYDNEGNTWVNTVYQLAEEISNEDTIEVSLINKIILSTAIRLKTEFHLKNILLANNIEIDCKKDQTRVWSRRASDKISFADKEIIRDVLLITPESLHVNAFMYEPLIDMPNYQLIDLYKKCESFGKDDNRQ